MYSMQTNASDKFIAQRPINGANDITTTKLKRTRRIKQTLIATNQQLTATTKTPQEKCLFFSRFSFFLFHSCVFFYFGFVSAWHQCAFKDITRNIKFKYADCFAHSMQGRFQNKRRKQYAYKFYYLGPCLGKYSHRLCECTHNATNYFPPRPSLTVSVVHMYI